MRVVIAEDSVLLREGLVRLFEGAGFDVVAAVGEAGPLLAAVEEHGPDLAVIDIRMPPGHTDEGLRAALQLHRTRPQTAVMVLSQYVEERYARRLLADRVHGIGYLLKDKVADVGEFLDALRRVAAGGTVLDPEVVSQLLNRHRADSRQRLTRREAEVLQLMAAGRSNAGIAATLVISESTVAKHVNAIFTKLEIEGAETDHRRVLAVLRHLQS